MDDKFKIFINLRNKSISTEEKIKLLPLALEALEVKVENLPSSSKGEALLEIAKNAFRNRTKEVQAQEIYDENSRIYQGCYHLIDELKNAGQLDRVIDDLLIQSRGSSASSTSESESVEDFGSDESHTGGEPGSEAPETEDLEEVNEGSPQDRMTELGITLTGDETTEQVIDMLTALENEGKLTMEESTDLYGFIEEHYPLKINDQIVALNKENADLEAENQENREGIVSNREHQELITEVDHAQNTQGHTNAIEQLTDNVTINEEIIAENKKKIEALQAEKASFGSASKEIAVANPQQTDIVTVNPQQTDLATVTPQNTDIAVVDPRQTDLATVTPQNTDIAVVDPRQTDLATVTPQNTDIAVVDPRQTDLATVTPQNTDIAVVNQQPVINNSQAVPNGTTPAGTTPAGTTPTGTTPTHENNTSIGTNTEGSSTPNGTDTGGSDNPIGTDTTTAVVVNEPVQVDPTEAFYASETILGEHSEEKFPFTKHGITVYKPRERGIHETDEEYVAYLKNYYDTLFGKFKEMDDALARVTEIENKIAEEKNKMQEAFNKINELKAGFGVPFAGATTPEEMAEASKKFMEELQTAIKNYEFYQIRINELNKELEKAKADYDALTFKPNAKTNNQNNQHVAGLLTDGKEHVIDNTFKPAKPPVNGPGVVQNGGQPLLEDPNKKIAGLLPAHEDDEERKPEDEDRGEIAGLLPPHVEPQGEKPKPPVPPVPPKPPVQPEPPKPPVPPEPTEEEQEEQKTGRPLETILYELVKGLGIQMKDNKTYNLSNIQVSGTMKAKLKQGNYIYNTVAALNIGTYLSLPINLIKKVSGKIRMTPAAKERIDALRLRIDELSEEDLMVIYKEYRADRAGQNRDMDLVNTLLGERIGKFIDAKITEINAKLTELYSKIVEDFKKMSELKTQQDAAETDEEKAKIEEEYDALLVGKADMISQIQALQIEGRNWLSGGGHGFEEDMKAAKSKMTFMGKRFSKSRNTNEALNEEESRLSQELQAALSGKTKSDEKALITFLQLEKLKSDNTIIKNSIFGKRSVGDRYYEPLVTKMDYRNDPFVQDLMGAVATMGGIINIVGSVKNAAAVKAQTDAANAQIDAANQAKANAETQIHDYGDQIEQRSEAVFEGQQAQAVENELAHMNTAERYTLDATNWGIGSSRYSAMDDATHAAYNARYTEIQNQVNDIANNYASGAVNITDALRSMEGVAREQQQGFIEMLSEYQPTLIDYAATHPQFDLRSLTDSVDYMINHPNAISDAVGAQASIANIGQELQKMTLGGDIQGIQIATSIWPQIVGTGSAYILAANVANQMKANSINGRYGNAVIDMMKELDGEALAGMSR